MTIKISIAQHNAYLGDIKKNTNTAIKNIKKAIKERSSIIIFPEMFLSGYFPYDYIFDDNLYEKIDSSLKEIEYFSDKIAIVIGYPYKKDKKTYYNRLSYIKKFKYLNYDKINLPNYGVFEEKRYFCSGNEVKTTIFSKISVGFLICEDLWEENILKKINNKIDLIISINASPFYKEKNEKRKELLKYLSNKYHIAIIYCNLVGGQDEFIFDGNSMVCSSIGKIIQIAPTFNEKLSHIYYDNSKKSFLFSELYNQYNKKYFYEELIINSLIYSLKEYIIKNNFKKVILGLSGGIDSSLTLYIASQSLKKENIKALIMPSKFTSKLSISSAVQQCKDNNIAFDIIPINDIYNIFINILKINNRKTNITMQNIQARIRCILLMSYSNKENSLVLSTSNKSEIALGYSTIYGDSSGGFCILKDVLKTEIYKLSYYIYSKNKYAIPINIITRPPTAELCENQLDSDDLPSYQIIDKILKLKLESNLSNKEIYKILNNNKTVNKILEKIQKNEYKRSQMPIGPRISKRSFGKEYRYPITYYAKT